jgi:hypothetical protein
MLYSISFNQIVTAVMTSGLIAGLLTAMPAMPAPLVQNESSVSVNRGAKGDQLPQMVTKRQSQIETVTPSRRIPIGCDPAFSPIADPAHAHIYKRCMA